MTEKQPKQASPRGADRAPGSVRVVYSVPDETGGHFRTPGGPGSDRDDDDGVVAPLLLTIREVARMLSVSERHVRALHSSGGLPRPIRLGRSVRWDREELVAWIQAGAPSRHRWEQGRTAG